MDNRKIFIILLLFIFVGFKGSIFSIPPKKHKNVPSNAIWDERFKIWKSGDINKDYMSWYENGKVKLKITRIDEKKIKINKQENYHQNGNLKKIGYEIFIKHLRDKIDGGIAGWKTLGKWREYFESGKLKKEYCYTLILEKNAYWTVAPCGNEIEYSEDGKIIKQINHKLKCDYDCDIYDPLKKLELK